MTERLYRHPTDRAIAGVAGGLAAWLNLDPSLVRVAWVLLAFFSGGLFVIVYIVMMIVVPLPPPGWIPRPRDGGLPGAAPGWPPGPGPAAGWPPDPASMPTPSPEAGQPWPATPSAGPSPTPGWGTGPDGTWTAPPAATRTSRPGNAGLVLGVILVGLGVWFLVDQYVSIDWAVLWPVAIMVVGGALIAGALLRARSD